MLCYKTAWAAADLDDMLCMDPQGFGLWPSTRGFRGSSAAWEEESRLVSHKSSADRSFLLSKIVQSLLPWRKYEIMPHRITGVSWLPSSLTMLWIEPIPLFVLLVRDECSCGGDGGAWQHFVLMGWFRWCLYFTDAEI